MNAYPEYGANMSGPPPMAPPRQSSLHSGQARLEPFSHRTSESSSISYDSSRRSSNDSSKPRLSKDQQNYLEAEFRRDPKPRREVKHEFAARMGISADKVNNWFQNKRAKSRNDAKKQSEQDMAYQIYMTNGMNASQSNIPYPTAFVNPSMHPIQQTYPAQYNPLPPQMEFQDGSLEPSLDAAHLNPQQETLYTHFVFDDPPQQLEPYSIDATEDPMTSFLGLGRPVQSMEDLQQQQSRFGNGAMTMGTISEEMEEPHHETVPTSGPLPHQAHDVAAHWNDTMDPGAFEMPINDVDYSQLGPHTTWGASAGTQEFDHPAVPNDTKHSSATNYTSTLPYRGPAPQQQQPMNTAQMEAFHQPPFFDQPIVPSQHQQAASFNTYQPSLPMDYDRNQREDSMSHTLSPPTSAIGRRDSAVSNLADNVSNIGVQPPTTNSQPSALSSNNASGLTVRKQQRRPPPLSTARTNSSGVPVPPSPKTTGYDANLRRIKSSGNFGAGRIQKSAASSAQRSPMTANFSHTNLSSQSMSNLTGEMYRRDSNAPMTPASPGDGFTLGPAHGQNLTSSRSMSHLRYTSSDSMSNAASRPPMPIVPMPTFFSHRGMFEGRLLEMSPPETPGHATSGFVQQPTSSAPPAQEMPPPTVPASAPPYEMTFNTFMPPHNQPQVSVPQAQTDPQQQFHPYTQPGTSTDAQHRSLPGSSRHSRTATAQYVGPAPGQFYGQPDISGPLTMSNPQTEDNTIPQQPHGTTQYSFENYGPQLSRGSQAQSGPVTLIQQEPAHDHSQLTQMQQAYQYQPSPPGPRSRVMSDASHSSPDPPRPPSENQLAHQKSRPPQHRFIPQESQGFNQWDSNERTNSPHQPPPDKKYSFIHFDGVTGTAPYEKEPPKSAGLPSYGKIEFLNMSPQAYRRGSTSTSPGFSQPVPS